MWNFSLVIRNKFKELELTIEIWRKKQWNLELWINIIESIVSENKLMMEDVYKRIYDINIHEKDEMKRLFF